MTKHFWKLLRLREELNDNLEYQSIAADPVGHGFNGSLEDFEYRWMISLILGLIQRGARHLRSTALNSKPLGK